MQFTVVYMLRLPSGQNREYGIITTQEGHDLPQHLLAEGLVKMRDDASKKAETEFQISTLEKLQQEEAKARAGAKGLWSKLGSKIVTKYELSNPKSFADEWKGKPIDGIVEHVPSGDRMIIRLKVYPAEHIQVPVLLAGIRAPATKRANQPEGKEQDGEPYGEDARVFVDERLLQRNVVVNVVGVSPQGQLVGTVKHPERGNIAEFLLQAGLARCTDHHSTWLGGEMAKLRESEKHARENKNGLFQGHVPTKTFDGDADVTVTKVQTADTIYVRNRSGVEKRLNLSSVRQPKPSDPKQALWQPEAKEFLRKKLIGKRVRATTDGKKAASEGYEEREVATIMLNNQNVALQLVEAGYASVIRHRRDDGTSFANDSLTHELIIHRGSKPAL